MRRLFFAARILLLSLFTYKSACGQQLKTGSIHVNIDISKTEYRGNVIGFLPDEYIPATRIVLIQSTERALVFDTFIKRTATLSFEKLPPGKYDVKVIFEIHHLEYNLYSKTTEVFADSSTDLLLVLTADSVWKLTESTNRIFNNDINHPFCIQCRNGEHVIPIVYGLPSKRGFRDAKRKKILLGGCSPEPERWFCTYHQKVLLKYWW